MSTGLDFVQGHLGDSEVVDTAIVQIGHIRVIAVLVSDDGMPGREVMGQWDRTVRAYEEARQEAEEESALAAYQALPRRKRRLVDQLIQELTDRNG